MSDDWMEVRVTVPSDVGVRLLEHLRRQEGFVDIAPVDWCTLERREDFARVEYAPCEPLTGNRYVIDWRDA